MKFTDQNDGDSKVGVGSSTAFFRLYDEGFHISKGGGRLIFEGGC